MKVILYLITIIALISFVIVPVYAHSGCCSHHDGVRADGCGCNDGTPLSDTCAPYYTCNAPQQNTAPANTSSEDTNTYVPVYVAPTDTPTSIPTYTPTPTMTPTPTPKIIKKLIHKTTKKLSKSKPTSELHKNWWQWLFGL